MQITTVSKKEAGGTALSPLSSVLDGDELRALAPLTLGEEPLPPYPLDMRQMGPIASLQAVEKRKKCVLIGNRKLVIQPVARRYTD
jgi:hypothetical protein